METFYTAYTKVVNNETYFFVKKFTAFPELKDVSDVLESFGMHTDFNKACGIAGIKDATLRQQLLRQAESTLQQAKVVDFTSTAYGAQKIAR